MTDTKEKDPLLGEDGGDAGSDQEGKKPGETAEGGRRSANAMPRKDTTADQTKAILAKCKKVNFIIPLEQGEKPGAAETVQINGYGLTIQKGVMVELPEPVARLLAEKYRINITAGMDKQVGRSAEVSKALE